MSNEPDEAALPSDAADTALNGAVVVGVVPEQPARVVKEAVRYAGLLGAPLAVVHVDVTRFVTYEDPDGYVHSAPIDMNIDIGTEQFRLVEAQVSEQLAGTPVSWETRQLVGDPALAMKHFSEVVDARLLVVGTRKRGLGESIREFFTGSVAARLSHRQHLPILVVPLEEPLSDDEDIWPEND